jgi:hypothetical protein
MDLGTDVLSIEYLDMIILTLCLRLPELLLWEFDLTQSWFKSIRSPGFAFPKCILALKYIYFTWAISTTLGLPGYPRQIMGNYELFPKRNYFRDISAYESRIQSNDMSRSVEAVELAEVFHVSYGCEMRDKPVTVRADTGST